jgi:HprK-related kinase A
LKISELSAPSLVQSLKKGELVLDIHPFVVRVTSNLPTLARDLGLMYADFPLAAGDTFADFHIEVSRPSGLSRWFDPQAVFYLDKRQFFVPLSPSQSFAAFEWGLNWCVAAHSHQYLIIHAAVVEKNGKAAVLPAPPGSGKSTLCAGLVQRGWRLLSDELALYDMQTGLISGMARPINLKNASIDVIQKFEPGVVMTPPVPNTTKGTVALVRPPAASVARVHEPVNPSWIILPRFEADSAALLSPHGKAKTFLTIAEQSFNYDIHGLRGFEAAKALIDRTACLTFTYSRLDDAVRVFDALAEGGAP